MQDDKKCEIKKILENKFKYTDDVLADKILEVFDETDTEEDYYDKKQKSRLEFFKYNLYLIFDIMICAVLYTLFLKK